MILVVAGGYKILDVRADSEIDFVGNYPRDQINGSKFVVASIVNATRKYDSEKGEKVYQQSVNADFKAQVEKLFPDKEAKVIVACSDGRNRTLQALETMDEMGYVNICGLRGGYNLWNRHGMPSFARATCRASSRKTTSTVPTVAACTPPVRVSKTKTRSNTLTGETPPNGSTPLNRSRRKRASRRSLAKLY